MEALDDLIKSFVDLIAGTADSTQADYALCGPAK